MQFFFPRNFTKHPGGSHYLTAVSLHYLVTAGKISGTLNKSSSVKTIQYFADGAFPLYG